VTVEGNDQVGVLSASDEQGRGWFAWWSSQMQTEKPTPVFRASETYAIITDRQTLNVSVDPANINVVRRVLPGPMRNRQILGFAEVHVENSTILLIREVVQRWNYSVDGDDESGEYTIQFFSPSVMDVQPDKEGYVDITVTTAQGTSATVSKLLFYSEDCPQMV
jgi:hypothetical protein